MIEMLPPWVYHTSTWILPVLCAVTLHEAAHGFVAWRLGDDTAYRMGRISLNPLRHIDLVGTVLLPALLIMLRAPFLFGWAKPIPVVSHRLRHPRWGVICVAIAGPTANLLLAVLAALLAHAAVHAPASGRAWLLFNIQHAIQLNVMLALFNMIPVPPLDGGLVMVRLLPRILARRLTWLEKHGTMLLLAILLIIPTIGYQIGTDWNLLTWLLGAPATLLYELVLRSAGLVS
ncbi:FIG004556: membrane metalloprotease [invertebrate metagenome]|uniref:FIG004556: membrane metalloprotease n=1 Tax=invertebrate metagenome TaxID=1711999 RepID=A0A484H592_9ZZZZ